MQIRDYIIALLLFTGVFIIFGGIYMELAEDPQYGYTTEVSQVFQDVYTNSSTLRGVMSNVSQISFDIDEEFSNSTAKDYDNYFDLTGGFLKAISLAKDSFTTVTGVGRAISTYLHVPAVFFTIFYTILGIMVVFAILYTIFKVKP